MRKQKGNEFWKLQLYKCCLRENGPFLPINAFRTLKQTTLIAFVAIIQILNQKSRYCSTPGNFPHLLHIKTFFHFNHFQLNQAVILVPFLPFPTRNPPAHTIMANFHMKNHTRLRWHNQLIHKLRVCSDRSKGSWFKPWVFQN